MATQPATNHLIDQDAEDAIIGCLLTDATLALPKVFEYGLMPFHFGNKQNARALTAILDMNPDDIDPESVEHEMKLRNLWIEAEHDHIFLDNCYWRQPFTFAPHVAYWAEFVFEMYKRRQMLTQARTLATDAINLKKPLAKQVKPPEVIPV